MDDIVVQLRECAGVDAVSDLLLRAADEIVLLREQLRSTRAEKCGYCGQMFPRDEMTESLDLHFRDILLCEKCADESADDYDASESS